MQSFSRFSDFPIEIRLLIWEHHFDSYFKSPLVHTLNGGFLSWDTGQLEPLSSLRSITCRGRLLKSLADRYDWHTRDVPILQWKTVIHDLSPVSGKIYSAHPGVIATWPGLRPLINHEALGVARARCKRYEVVDLWLDNSTLNISQPCLVDVISDVFRIDPGIAKMMLGFDGALWLARIRRLAIGPFDLRRQYDVTSVLRILEHTQDLKEIYILLSPEVTGSQTWHHNVYTRRSKMGFSLLEVAVGDQFETKIGELESLSSSIPHGMGDWDGAETLRAIVHQLNQRCSSAKITYGCLDV
ncbi:hypothetical protein GQX73_g1632 [Xylaria multiplex]|uniref:Uncharacterized protein n=1 Tax=Xylaria multiplex TaxID=323545 RepID=A0A7C8ITK8_9PEZI|nr:hypothetical protein GQX73_g1632 [Xylaria multiplex]